MKIAVIGAGAVGSTIAYTLILRNTAAHIMLVDIDPQKCAGHVADLEDTLSISHTASVGNGSLVDAGTADIAIIAAGIPQCPGQTRMDLLHTNAAIIKDIIRGMKPLNPSLIIIIVTNPVDMLTYLCQEITPLPRNQIFGSGTMLDTQRLRAEISKAISIAPQSIDSYVLGEHGDTQTVVWSSATVAGIPIADFDKLNNKMLQQLANRVKNKGYDIIEKKGCTNFGVAACVSTYCQSIVFDTKLVIPVSCYVQDFKVCMSLPAVIGARGVEKNLIPPLTTQEKKNVESSAAALREMIHYIT